MTTHFSNILTYQYFQEVNFSRKIYVDGFLLQLALFLVTFKWYRKRSGLNFHHNMEQDLNFYLLARHTRKRYRYLELPFWRSVEDILLDHQLLDSIKNYKYIVIGISSPKQDYLAELLNEQFPEKEFFCLGAAVYTKSVYHSEWMIVTLGTMFVSNPKRTMMKMALSVNSFIRAITLDRKKLKLFSRLVRNH